jgi:hypothetical protein
MLTFVLKVLKVLKYVLKIILNIIKVIKNYICQVLRFQSCSAQSSVKLHHYIVCGSMLLGVHIVSGHSAQGQVSMYMETIVMCSVNVHV